MAVKMKPSCRKYKMIQARVVVGFTVAPSEVTKNAIIKILRIESDKTSNKLRPFPDSIQ